MRLDTSKAKAPLKLYVDGPNGMKQQLESHVCGECLIVKPSEREALECHAIRRCDCGEEITENYYTACDSCRAKHDAARYAERVAAARRIPEAETEHLYCGCCEEFFDSSAELFEVHQDQDRPLPSFAWATRPVALSMDAAAAVEAALKNSEIDTDEISEISREDMRDLQVQMDAWCAKSMRTGYYVWDTGVGVDLVEARSKYLAENPEPDEGAVSP